MHCNRTSNLIFLNAPNCTLQALDETLVLAWLIPMASIPCYIVPFKAFIHANRSPISSRILGSSPNKTKSHSSTPLVSPITTKI